MLGTVLDGIPESMVIGLTIFQGGAVGAAYLTAVFISNLPEAIASTSGLVANDWRKSRILWMWVAITLISGLASLAGYAVFQESSPATVAFVLTFAAGAILTMLAETMMPEAYEHGGKLVGIATTLGLRGRLHDPSPGLTSGADTDVSGAATATVKRRPDPATSGARVRAVKLGRRFRAAGSGRFPRPLRWLFRPRVGWVLYIEEFVNTEATAKLYSVLLVLVGLWVPALVNLRAIAVIISGLGALVGWTMICAEMPLAAAKDGLFPEHFNRVSKSGCAGVRDHRLDRPRVDRDHHQLRRIERADRLHHADSDDGHHGRDSLRVLRARADEVAGYADRRAMDTPRFLRDMIVAIVSLAFSILFIWYSRNTGHSTFVYWAPFLLAGGALLLGIPVYTAQRTRMTEPGETPPYR